MKRVLIQRLSPSLSTSCTLAFPTWYPGLFIGILSKSLVTPKQSGLRSFTIVWPTAHPAQVQFVNFILGYRQSPTPVLTLHHVKDLPKTCTQSLVSYFSSCITCLRGPDAIFPGIACSIQCVGNEKCFETSLHTFLFVFLNILFGCSCS